jgi:hypothetical protein
MPKFRKKPIIVEAVQFTDGNLDEVAHFVGTALAFEGRVVPLHPEAVRLTTIHGDTAYARPGDWIIPEPMPGRFYPVKPDIFAATYEPV